MTESSSSEEVDMTEEYFDTLNRLIEKGKNEAVKSYIEEKRIRPVAIYRYFCSSYASSLGFVYKGLCPVSLAAKCGHVQVLKTLIDAGFLANEGSEYFDNTTPLHHACEEGNIDVVKMLVEEYHVDITDKEKCYSRHFMCVAAEEGHIEILRYFIEKREISVNSRYGEAKDSALHAAAEYNQVDVCKYLISRGADVNIVNNYRQTPLLLTTRSRSHNEIARVLLDAGADVNFVNGFGETAFFKAAERGNLVMMKIMHSRGADPEVKDRFYRSPLHIAVSDDRRDMVFYLVNQLNVTIQPTEYYEEPTEYCEEPTESYEETMRVGTVCSMALRERCYDMVKHLFNAGYDPSQELHVTEYEDSDDNNSYTGSSEDSDSASPRKKRKSFPLSEDKVKLRELKQMVARPRSLLALSVLKVRRLLGRRLPVDLSCLPLPDILKNVIVSCGEKKP